MEQSQRMMNWLEKSKKNDEFEVQQEKKKIISELKGIKVEEIFPQEVKLTLWQRIKKTFNF